ncbi:ATP-binding protein [Phytohabitans sp. LJ34]|uniref:ATP-binding protein n=1 Tax=Phytohabitans sp. LJ34 TaxID=3452217 RepID=UPI003F8C5D20
MKNATGQTPDRWLSLELEPRVEAARLARQLVATACARWRRDELTESAHIAVTELVNNAVVHAGTPITVEVTLHGDELHIAVHDRSTQPPQPRVAAPTSYGGRGLALLDSLSARWGWRPKQDGKVVWAVLS